MSTTPPDDPYGDDPYGPQQQGPYPYGGLEEPDPHPPLNPAPSPLEPRRAHAAPTPTKPKRKKWPWVLLALALIAILFLFAFCRAFVGALEDPKPVASASTSATAHGPSAATPAKKVQPYVAEVTKCESGEFGFDATVKIKNNTDDEVTYLFDLLLLDKNDNTVGNGIGSVKVKGGKSGETTLLADLDGSYKGKKSDVDCEVKVTDF